MAENSSSGCGGGIGVGSIIALGAVMVLLALHWLGTSLSVLWMGICALLAD